MSSIESIRDRQADSSAEAPNNVAHLPGSLPELDGKPEPDTQREEPSQLGMWLWALGAIAAIGLLVFASMQYSRANALDAAVVGLNAQLESTRGVLVATEADLELTRSTLGVYAERMDQVRGRVDSIATQLGELGAIVSVEALPAVPVPPNDR